MHSRASSFFSLIALAAPGRDGKSKSLSPSPPAGGGRFLFFLLFFSAKEKQKIK